MRTYQERKITTLQKNIKEPHINNQHRLNLKTIQILIKRKREGHLIKAARTREGSTYSARPKKSTRKNETSEKRKHYKKQQ